MDERRRNKRLELSSRILIKRLGQNVAEEVHIDISDVSKTGVGFTCSTRLEVGAVYESFLTIWTSEVLHTFLEVVRISRSTGLFLSACQRWMPAGSRPMALFRICGCKALKQK